jgi:DnaK suppressor protein
MKRLQDRDIARLRETLEHREAQLAAEVESAMAAERARTGEGREVDPGVVELDSALRIADIRRDEVELSAIHAALTRMDRGSYGRCLSCGTHIPIERLRAEPTASLCRVCQGRAEEGFGHPHLAP